MSGTLIKKKLFAAAVCLLFLLLPAASASAAGTIQEGSTPLRYLLYVPDNAEEPMPLVVYLHGGSGRGDDPEKLLEIDGFPQYLAQGKLGDVRAYVLMPQLPSDTAGWAEAGESVMKLIDNVCETYAVDADRISLTGHSMGGTGTWALAAAYPQRFSCAAPLSGSVQRTPQTMDALETLPIWAFVGAEDTVVPPNASDAMVKQLRARGANARLTVLDGASHTDVPAMVYLDTELDVLGWLTSQRCGESESAQKVFCAFGDLNERGSRWRIQ